MVTNSLHAHHADILPSLLSLDFEHFDRTEGTQLYPGHPGEVTYQDINYDFMANHKKPICRGYKSLQIVVNVSVKQIRND